MEERDALRMKAVLVCSFSLSIRIGSLSDVSQPMMQHLLYRYTDTRYASYLFLYIHLTFLDRKMCIYLHTHIHAYIHTYLLICIYMYIFARNLIAGHDRDMSWLLGLCGLFASGPHGSPEEGGGQLIPSKPQRS